MTTENELQKNIKAYDALESSVISENIGKYALLSDGALIETYNDFGDAYKIGVKEFGAGNFSLKLIGEQPASLGFSGYEPVSVFYNNGCLAIMVE